MNNLSWSFQPKSHAMPARLPQLVRAIAIAANPHDVLDDLQKRAGPLNVHSAWSRSLDHYDARDIVYHNSVPVKFRQDYQAEIQKHGLSPTTRLALTEPLSFTFTEARRKLRPAGHDQWIFNLLQDHGMRDGLAVPRGNWVVLYWSPRVLNGLGHETRMALDASGAACIYRLKELMAKRKTSRSVELAPSELAVLEHLSRGPRVGEIAKHMEISERTVRDYLRRAQKKLNAVTPTEAAVIAVRRRLI